MSGVWTGDMFDDDELALDFEYVTWGDVRAFVRCARRGQIARKNPMHVARLCFTAERVRAELDRLGVLDNHAAQAVEKGENQ